MFNGLMALAAASALLMAPAAKADEVPASSAGSDPVATLGSLFSKGAALAKQGLDGAGKAAGQGVGVGGERFAENDFAGRQRRA